MCTNTITDELRETVTMHCEGAVARSGARKDNRVSYCLPDMWHQIHEERNRRGDGFQCAENLPLFSISKDRAKKNVYLNGHKTSSLPSPLVEDDFGVAYALDLCLKAGFGSLKIDPDDEEKLSQIPLVSHPIHYGKISDADYTNFSKRLFGVDGIGILDRLSGVDAKTHWWRQDTAALCVAMGVSNPDLQDYFGWSAKTSGGRGEEVRNDSVAHYGIDVQVAITKALVGFRPEERWRTPSYSALSETVHADQHALVNKFANFLIGRPKDEEPFDFKPFSDRSRFDKLSKDAKGHNKRWTLNCIYELSAHLLIHLPVLKKKYPELFLFTLPNSPCESEDVKEYLKSAQILLDSHENAVDAEAAANAGPWAADVSQKLVENHSSLQQKLDALPTREESREAAAVAGREVAVEVAAAMTNQIAAMMTAGFMASKDVTMPATPQRFARALQEKMYAAAQSASAAEGTTPRSISDVGSDDAAAAGGSGGVSGGRTAAAGSAAALSTNPQDYVSTPTNVEKMKCVVVDGKREKVSYNPKRYFFLPFGGDMPSWGQIKSYERLLQIWTVPTPTRPSYEQLEAMDGARWRKNAALKVQQFVTITHWILDLLTAATSRSESTHFDGQKLCSSRVEAAKMLDAARLSATAGISAPGSATVFNHYTWLLKQDGSHAGHEHAITAWAKSEVERMRAGRKTKKKEEKAILAAAKAKRKAERDERTKEKRQKTSAVSAGKE